MANMSNYLEQQLLAAIFKNQSYSAGTVYVALCTSALTDADTGASLSEPNTGAGYVRKSTAPTDWSTHITDDGTIENVNNIEWLDVTWSDTIVAVALTDASAGGNVLFWGPLITPKVVSIDDSVRFSPGALIVQIDD